MHDDIPQPTQARCPDCNRLLFAYKMIHNGKAEIVYRCQCRETARHKKGYRMGGLLRTDWNLYHK